MLSLSAFLASLPPVALAETDLARFCALVLGRRARSELPGLALLLAEEILRGYPAGLAAILRAVIGQILDDDLEVELVDAASVERLFGRAPFLERLAKLTDLRRERLRPGTIVGSELRMVTGRRLQVIGSYGTQLALIYPVDLARVPDAHFAVPRGPVLAMEMENHEIEVLRDTWIAVEGATGLDGPEAQRWTARFFSIARRPGIDVAAVQRAVVQMSPELRSRLSEALVAHCRDGELSEHHRPGARGLERRLARLGIELDSPWAFAAAALVAEVFASAAADPMVERGYCSVPPEDLATWAEWVEVPAAARATVAAMAPAEIEAALMHLAEVEAGRVDERFEPTLRRGLQSLRDHCLRPRWLRSRAALDGLDLLRICDSWLARGDDLTEKLGALQRIAVEAEVVSEELALAEAQRVALETAQLAAAAAQRAAESQPPEAPPLAPELQPGQRSFREATPAPELTELRFESPLEPAQAEALEAAQAAQADDIEGQSQGEVVAVETPLAVAPADGEPAAPTARTEQPFAQAEQPTAQTEQPRTPPPEIEPPRGIAVRVPTQRVTTASKFELPPMPKPPPMRPRTATGFPALASTPPSQSAPTPARSAPQPVVNTPRAPAEPEDAPRVVRRLPTSQPAREAKAAAPRPATEGAPRPLGGGASRLGPPAIASTGARSAIISHLMTPTQAHAFYEESFRELEVIERDVLRGGHSASVAKRLDVIAADTTAIVQALGPGARSGDREFQVAIERMERVEHYLLRIRGVELDEPGVRRDRPKSFWKTLLGRKD